MKIPKRTQLNQRTFHNLQSDLASWYTEIRTSIKHTICESLVKYNNSDIWMVVNYVWKYPKKRNKIKGRSVIWNHIWHIYISKCVYWLDTYFVNVWWSYALPNTNAVHFYVIFSDIGPIGQYFQSSQTQNLKNQKLDYVRIILDNIRYF